MTWVPSVRLALRDPPVVKMIIPNEIMVAARDGDTQTVERFLDEGGDVNAYDARGTTLLRECASSYHKPPFAMTVPRPILPSQVELCRVLVARGGTHARRGSAPVFSRSTPARRLWVQGRWVVVCTLVTDWCVHADRGDRCNYLCERFKY